jgi:RimJ/RimL family protein N-acetyltransferase
VNAVSKPSVAVRTVPFAAEHLEQTARWLTDPALLRQIDSAGPMSPEGHRAYWEGRLANPREDNRAIVANGQHVGNCGMIVDESRRKAELWIYLGSSRGQGVGCAAVQAMLVHGFERRGLHRVFVRVLVSNEPALAFWRSLGFVEEGTARHDTWIDGQPVDAQRFSLLDNEWRVQRTRA